MNTKTKITAKAKATKDCFKDFYYRDSYLNKWLPKEQPAREGEVTVLSLDKEMTFLEMAEHFLGTKDPAEIKKYTLTLPMVEKLVENAEANGLRIDGWGNFFFVENADGSVSVANVNRNASQWNVNVNELADSYRWHADNRLMVWQLDTRANLDSMTLPIEENEVLAAIECVKAAGYQVVKIM